MVGILTKIFIPNSYRCVSNLAHGDILLLCSDPLLFLCFFALMIHACVHASMQTWLACMYWHCSIDQIGQRGGPALSCQCWRKALFFWQIKAAKANLTVFICSVQSFSCGKNEFTGCCCCCYSLWGQFMSNTSPVGVIHKLTSTVWLIDFCESGAP